MKKILITGGTGFIGSHTCISLLEKGYTLVVIDSNINSSPKSLERVNQIVRINNKFCDSISFEKGDIRDNKFLKNVFEQAIQEKYPIEAVIHFAGLKSVSESICKPIDYWDVNVNGTINLLKVMDIYDCRTIVFSSSATIYGSTNINPINESFNINPINPYGQTKAAVELLLRDLFNSSKNTWRIANLRYFNPIGAHFSGLIGEDPFAIPNNLFPFVTRVAKGIYKKLYIFGNDWPTEDGTGIRDYIHVMDLAEAHVSALEFLIKNHSEFICLNIGTGKGTSVLELVETFKEVNKCEVPFEFCNRRSGDVPMVIADNKKALSTLNWQPNKSLEDMCRDGWSWQTLNPKGYAS